VRGGFEGTGGERERLKGRTVNHKSLGQPGPNCDIRYRDLDFACTYRNAHRKQSNCDVTKTKSRGVSMVRRRRHKPRASPRWERGDSLIHRSSGLRPRRDGTARRTTAVALESELLLTLHGYQWGKAVSWRSPDGMITSGARRGPAHHFTN
jgi:hypothetical protein